MTEERKEEERDLEGLFAELEETVKKLESDEISLEGSFALYQKGMELLRKCNDKIDMVEKKVQILDEYGESHEF